MGWGFLETEGPTLVVFMIAKLLARDEVRAPYLLKLPLAFRIGAGNAARNIDV